MNIVDNKNRPVLSVPITIDAIVSLHQQKALSDIQALGLIVELQKVDALKSIKEKLDWIADKK